MLVPLPKLQWSAFTHEPVWHPWVLGWSINGCNLPSQANSQQEITTGLAGETGHWCGYICDLWRWKSLNWSHLAIKTFLILSSCHFVAFHHPTTPSTPIGLLVVLTTLWNKLSKMADILSIEGSIHWMVLDYRLVEKCTQSAPCILEIQQIKYFKIVFLNIYNTCVHTINFLYICMHVWTIMHIYFNDQPINTFGYNTYVRKV